MEAVFRKSTLYVVATPIGNLEDISARAIAVLSGVDLIAAEDTRTTGVLLRHFGIATPMVSYFSANEEKRIPELIGKLKAGHTVAVVSDAGTPAISDPASRLISAAVAEQIPVVSIPGATAFLPALIASGFPIKRFVFEGFLPIKKGRRTKVQALGAESCTIVLYESPHRIVRTLAELKEVVGDRRIIVARELTKKFEEIFRGTCASAGAHFSKSTPRGEFVVVIAGRG
jgi:16S rRNA (cytidine1402-2'-O)-methyltransferase